MNWKSLFLMEKPAAVKNFESEFQIGDIVSVDTNLATSLCEQLADAELNGLSIISVNLNQEEKIKLKAKMDGISLNKDGVYLAGLFTLGKWKVKRVHKENRNNYAVIELIGSVLPIANGLIFATGLEAIKKIKL